jgi:hypothetical protein
MNEKTISKQDQLLFFPKETILIGQWDPDTAPANNERTGG